MSNGQRCKRHPGVAGGNTIVAVFRGFSIFLVLENSVKGLQSVRGMHDILPESTPLWYWIERQFREVLENYGYQEIRLPIVEPTELFRRSIGDVTDIVEKEMYSFEDRNGDWLSLRPEGTASCVRAGIEHGFLHNQTPRLWYSGPMFRHERPQKGRYRQFHQLGVEVFGIGTPDIEAELLAMTARFWRQLGLQGLRLEINSLGNAEERFRYRERLIRYFRAHFTQLDPEAQRRLEENPLRLLDSKHPATAEIAAAAPVLSEDLEAESIRHINLLQEYLSALGIDYVFNPRLVRGLDYYSRTVFEWITPTLGTQGTICAGGRYDSLVEQLGGRSTPAIGLAMGMERLVALLDAYDSAQYSTKPDGYLITAEGVDHVHALRLMERLRDDAPSLRLLMHCGGGSVKSQLKKADRCGAEFALILGPEEQDQDRVRVKFLRSSTDEQVLVPEQALSSLLLSRIKDPTAGVRP